MTWAADKYITIGLGYDNFQLQNKIENHGGLINFSGYANEKIFILGGYGEVLLTQDLQLGKGGLLLGFGYTLADLIFLTAVGRIGLGGGAYSGVASATWQYGAEINFGFIKSQGIGVFVSYEIINNLFGTDALNVNGVQNISAGLRLLLKVK